MGLSVVVRNTVRLTFKSYRLQLYIPEGKWGRFSFDEKVSPDKRAKSGTFKRSETYGFPNRLYIDLIV